MLAVSVDTPLRNGLLRDHLGLEITFLSDPQLDLINQMGIPHKRRSKGEGPIAIPSQFLVDEAGIIRWTYISDTWRKRLPAEKVLAAVTAALP